ncbi:MAG TPA: hypothetical protein VKQ32_24430 [Polyangia bacterium]|nr:hypothetical protein [Polyangia bacterium]
MPRTIPLVTTLLSCAVLAGCGAAGGPDESGPPVTFDACAPLQVVADPAISDVEAGGITAGIAFWNTRAGTRLTLGGDPTLPGLPLHFQAAAPPFHGLYDAPSGQVFINTDLSGEALAVTIAHEIGHAFGLVHIPADQRASVMNPNNLVVEPTAEDVDTLAMRWGVCLASPSP